MTPNFLHRIGRFFPLLLCWLLLVPGMAAASSFTLNGPIPETRLEPSVSWFCAPDDDLTLEDIKELPFQPLARSTIVFGYNSNACWFHVRLENQSSSTLPLILKIENPILDNIDLYLPGHTPNHYQTGDSLPFAHRPLQTRNFSFPISLEAQQQQDVFIRIKSSGSIFVPISLSSRDYFIGSQESSEWIHGIGLGIIAGLLFYHLFLGLVIREQISRFYMIYLFSAFFYLLCFKGYGYRLWPDSPGWNSHAQLFFIFIMMSSGALFARDYLKIWLAPAADKLLLITASLSGSLVLLQFVLPLGMGYRLQSIVALIVIFAVCWSSIRPVREGNKESRLFLISWGLLVLMSLLLALQSLGVVDTLPFLISLNGMEATFILQQILLALAVAHRLESLKNEAQEKTQQAIRAQAENEAKSDFLAKMSHEIRTPMNALMGITQLLQDTDLDKTQKGYVDTLYSSSFSMLTVINDILDYSKISAGKIELRNEPFNLLDLLDECIQIFSLNAREKSIALVCERSRDLPSHICGDADRLRQILLNLLSNAIKFTDYGNVFLRVSVEEEKDGRLMLRFEVEDTGIGIEAEKMPQLFQNFSQIETPSSRHYGGSGLGLVISRQLVELMGGKITVESAPQRGSLFRFTVNVKPVLNCDKYTDPRTQAMSSTLFNGIRALVVEDNPINQMVVKGLLAKVGLEVKVASGGQEALDILKEEPREAYDLVFMDCEMPLMNGFETTKILREWEAETGRYPLPIIALTAHALPEHLQQCLDSGMNDYLTKPLLLPHLVEKLHIVLG